MSSTNTNYQPNHRQGSRTGTGAIGGNAPKFKDNTIGSMKAIFKLEKLFFSFSTATSTISCFMFAWGVSYNPQVFAEATLGYYALGALILAISLSICVAADFVLVGVVLKDAIYLAFAGLLYKGLTISQYVRMAIMFIFGTAGISFTVFTSFEGSAFSEKKAGTLYKEVAQHEPITDLQKKYSKTLNEALAPLNAEVKALQVEKDAAAKAFLGKDLYKLAVEKKNKWAVEKADSMGLKKALSQFDAREQQIRQDMEELRKKNKAGFESDEQIIRKQLDKQNGLTNQSVDMSSKFIFAFGFIPCILGVIIAMTKGAYKAERQYLVQTGQADPNDEDLLPN